MVLLPTFGLCSSSPQSELFCESLDFSHASGSRFWKSIFPPGSRSFGSEKENLLRRCVTCNRLRRPQQGRFIIFLEPFTCSTAAPDAFLRGHLVAYAAMTKVSINGHRWSWLNLRRVFDLPSNWRGEHTKFLYTHHHRRLCGIQINLSGTTGTRACIL